MYLEQFLFPKEEKKTLKTVCSCEDVAHFHEVITICFSKQATSFHFHLLSQMPPSHFQIELYTQCGIFFSRNQ